MNARRSIRAKNVGVRESSGWERKRSREGKRNFLSEYIAAEKGAGPNRPENARRALVSLPPSRGPNVKEE